jgi:hypothetical protein
VGANDAGVKPTARRSGERRSARLCFTLPRLRFQRPIKAREEWIMKIAARVAIGASALIAATGLGYGVGVTQMFQPHMQNALNDLQSARGELQAASHNKGGHRWRALDLTNQAIGEVQAGVACGMNEC